MAMPLVCWLQNAVSYKQGLGKFIDIVKIMFKKLKSYAH